MILDFLTSGTFGMITGLVGSVIKEAMALKQQKLQFDHDEKMVEKESAAAIAEVNANIKRDKIQAEGRIDEAIASNMANVLEQADKRIFGEEYLKYIANLPPLWGKKSYLGPVLMALVISGLAFVDLWRQSIRPTLTTYLAAVTTWLTYLSYKIVQQTTDAITAKFAQDIFQLVVNTVIYLTVMAFTFWFYDRAKDIKAQLAKRIK